MLIREAPATELTVATRILARQGRLAPQGRVALLVGSEVVYIGGRAAAAGTLTPYDLAAVRLSDGLTLVGDPPDDLERYLEALRSAPLDRCAALNDAGEVVTAAGPAALVSALVGLPWPEAEAEARAAGALIGAYAAEG